VKLFKY